MESKKKKRTKKIIVAGITVAAAGVLGYFGWQYWKKKKAGNGATDTKEAFQPFPESTDLDLPGDVPTTKKTSPKNPASSPVSSANKPKTGFPLKKGSKGELVRQLQQALIARHGKAILPKYGADADFGSETVAALKKVGLPSSINESTFNVIVQDAGNGSEPSGVGKSLLSAAAAGDYKKVLALLKQINGTQEYTAANNEFKTYRLRGVRQTIVNGILSTFTSAQQKEQIKYEFLRIGLQYDGSKWSLPALDGIPIITVIPTTVWLNAHKGVKVPARMVLGNEISRRLDYSLFENRGKYFLVNTRCVKHLK